MKKFVKFVFQCYVQDGFKEPKCERLANLAKLNNQDTTKDDARVFGKLQKLMNAFYKVQEQLNT